MTQNHNIQVSIVIPAYNAEAYLKETVDALLQDTYACREIIIVNDGSTDGSVEIAKEFVEKYPDTFRIVNKENGGHGSTINRGIKEAAGNNCASSDP